MLVYADSPRRCLRVLAILAACALLAAGVLATAASAAAPTTAGTAKVKSRTCGAVKIGKRHRALFVAAVSVSCKTAKRVARRARGKVYSASGFRCRVRKKRKGLPGKLYGCGRARAGTGQGVGFLYVRL